MSRKPNSGKRSNLSQFGLLDIPDFDDGDEPLDLSDDDIDLEAELAAISGGGGRHRTRKPAPVPAANLDAMIAESLKDIPSDDEGSGDDDDPDLLSELKELAIDDDDAPPPPPRTSRPAPPPPGSTDSSIISLLQDRISNYSIAEKNAKESGESSRARRFSRALKTLNDLLKQAKAGRPIKDEDIPPPVSIGKPAVDQPSVPMEPEPSAPLISPQIPEPETVSGEPPALPEPEEPPPPPPRVESQGVSPERQEGLQLILKRKEEFKAAALSTKHAGDKALALEYLKVVKQFEMVVDAYKAGQEMDLSELPTPEAIAAAFKSQQKNEDEVQNSTEAAPPEPAPEPVGLITASTLAEALKQRLAAFQEQESKAKEQGNSSKARRMGRIVKQYQDAIRLHAAGRPISADELPTPSGYGPLPTEQGSSPHTSPAKPAASPSSSPTVAPRAPTRSAPAPVAPSRHERQLALLLHKQKEFKDAALNAKRNGQNPPKFHYESREFSVVQCNADLNENDLELTIVRGISYNVPNPREIDTYVRFEFPYPQEAPVSERTITVKDTNSPQYDAVFVLPIQRSARHCLRVFKRHAIKFELYSKGGWFSRDTLLATAAVKLAPLETQVTVHDAFPLIEGRRPAGGTLEVKLRVRTPLLQPQVERSTHRWLVIDG